MELIVARPEMNNAGNNECRVRPMVWAALFAGQLFVCLTPALSQAQGQGEVWPSRSVRLIVPSGSGGAADFTARTFAKFAEQQVRQPVVVENRPGAGAIIGAEAVKNASPNGYTFLVSGNSTQAANPSLFVNLPYDPAKDFDEVGLFGLFPMVGMVRKGSPMQSVADLIQNAKSNPGKLSYGHHAASAQVPPEMIMSRAGVSMLGVTYKNLGQIITDVAGGTLDFVFLDALSAAPALQGGLLTAIAVTSPQRFQSLPNVQTVAEVLPGFEMQGWLGMSAPRGTPPAIVERMNGLMRDALAEQSVRTALEKQGMTVRASSALEHSAFVAADRLRWAEWVRIAKIKPASL